MYLELLPPRFREAIAFVTVKNGQLMVALRHPGFKMELNYNQELLKSLLSTLIAHRRECAFMEARSVAIFLSRHHTPPGERPSSDPGYSETATGDFPLSVHDRDLAGIFESIRSHIRKNRRRSRR
ncbi:DciA family protein [Nitratifractor sp.]